MAFWHGFDEAHTARKAAPRRKLTEAQVIEPGHTGCDHCPLRSTWPTIASPRMKLSGLRDGRVLVLAEGPGEVEDRQGKVLVGPSGEQFRQFVPTRFEIEEMALQNIVRCRPPNNRTPTMVEAHACSEHLEADIASMPNLRAILGLGAVPLRRFFPGASIMNVHGLRFPIEVAGRALWYYPAMHPAFILHTKDEDNRYENPALPVFRADIRNFFASVLAWDKPYVHKVTPADVILPTSEAEARALLAKMGDPLAVDLESSVLRPYARDAILLTAGFSDGRTTIAFSINHPEAPTSWGLRVLMDTVCSRPWIAHNAAMELTWFLFYNNTQQDIAPFDDTQALVRLIHQRERATGLEDASHLHLGINVKSLSKVDASRIMDYPLSEVLPYNGLDAWGSARIYRKLRNHVDEDGYQRIVGSVYATSHMELQGVPVDPVEAQRLKEHWLTEQKRIRFEASKLYEVRQYEADRGSEFKLTSAEQVGAALVAYGRLDLPLTKGGEGKQYATDEETLQPHYDSNPLVKAVMDDREATKIISTYIEPTLDVPKLYPDGLLHPTYTTMLVATLRLSSRAPNIQNYPVRKNKEVRRQVKAPPNHLIVKVDEGQLEARVLTMASRCKLLISNMISDFDIHSYWLGNVIHLYPDYLDRLAHETGEKDEEKLRRAGRNVIKSDFVFSTLYGGGADACHERTKIPLSIVYDLMAWMWEEYPEVRNQHNIWRREYRDTGGIATLTGRVRHGILKKGNEPINYPIQGTAADIVMEAMNELSDLSRQWRDPYIHPRMQIHDDLTFILPEDALEQYIDIIWPIMVKVRFGFQIVPLNVEIAIGENWCDVVPIKHVFKGDYIRSNEI